ncbi:HD domain-containing phosphohydrolase [Rhodocyclaceae bacterium SMB388]
MTRNFPLHIYISTVFLLLILVVGGTIGALGYRLAAQMLEATANDLTARIGQELASELSNLVAPAEMATNMVAFDALVDERELAARMRRLPLLREALRDSAALSSIYVGYADADFFLFRRLRDDAERRGFDAPPDSAYLVQSIARQEDTAIGRFVFLDQELLTLREDLRPEYAAGYDPRSRGWYRDALTASTAIKTPPYLFFSDRKVGVTLATPAASGNAVVGADIQLETLGTSLSRRKVTPGTHIALVNRDGWVLAHEDIDRLVSVPDQPAAQPTLRQLQDFGPSVLVEAMALLHELNGRTGIDTLTRADDDNWRMHVGTVDFDGVPPLYLVMAIPESELFADAIGLARTTAWSIIGIMLLAMPLTWGIARLVSGPLRKLSHEAEAIQRFEFLEPVRVESRVREVSELSRTMDGMKRTIRRFLDLSEAVAAETDFDRLLSLLLTETLSASSAEAGILYLIDDDTLVPAAATSRTGRDGMAGLQTLTQGQTGPLMCRALDTDVPLVDRLSDADIRAAGIGTIVSDNDCHEAVFVPLLNRDRQRVGALLLLHRKPIADAHVAFVKALSNSSATSLETRELIRAQKDLFEAFIRLVAGAIDAKSAYTGGHCARVPELTRMLAVAACADRSGPCKDFELDEQGWEALHVAAWLHDCGKVTTPEYVVDKATKLETIYDRIHEIRMRFEVLKRDAEIECCHAIARGEDEAAARAHRDVTLKQLNDDYAFVAGCNEGGEFMAPDKQARLAAIAGRTWLRTLDDRIGISYEEKARKARRPAQPLPVLEALIADKPEHLFERRAQDRLPQDERWGFTMAVPELLYNRGELHNLSVSRGTLSDEERFKINEHIVQTLVMLSQLPYPKHLRQVPEIVGGHHEKMDGSGYPRGLTRNEMSLQARMLAIADIFEALTAIDRPYKQGKTLSDAIRIMAQMKNDEHIDPDLFDLFLRSGVFRDYAERFMRPEQIDEVEIGRYL